MLLMNTGVPVLPVLFNSQFARITETYPFAAGTLRGGGKAPSGVDSWGWGRCSPSSTGATKGGCTCSPERSLRGRRAGQQGSGHLCTGSSASRCLGVLTSHVRGQHRPQSDTLQVCSSHLVQAGCLANGGTEPDRGLLARRRAWVPATS